MNRIVPGGYDAAAAGYFSSCAQDVAFYAAYDGTDVMQLLRQRRFECASTPADHIWKREEEAHSNLIRDIFGNPFRPAVIDPAWLEWNNGTVVKLAKSIYEDRRWDIMPILGDALEDAMCDNADILEHCRGPGPHVRGCWVVDLLLDKN